MSKCFKTSSSLNVGKYAKILCQVKLSIDEVQFLYFKNTNKIMNAPFRGTLLLLHILHDIAEVFINVEA